MKKKKDNSGMYLLILSLVGMMLIGLYFFAGSTVKSSGTKIGYTDNATRYSWHAEYEQIDGTFSKTIYPRTNPQEISISAETIDGSISILAECGDEVLFEGKDLQSGHTHILAEGKVKITVTAENHKGSFSISHVEEGHSH
ncbi:MAG: hypothetical protein IKM61_06470 [Eubacteriaceae bacterium]|nr:hypothetical protein [Eubacteriaceae bacterium]